MKRKSTTSDTRSLLRYKDPRSVAKEREPEA